MIRTPWRLSLPLLLISHLTLAAPVITLDEVATGLSQPLWVTHAGDGSGRLFVCEKTGRIRIVSGGAVLSPDFLNIGSTGLNLISTNSERGLLGLAFDPAYATNGFFYVSYTRASDGANIIDRFTVSGDPNVADTASRVTIFGPITQPQANHNGGWIGFGPDGFLYFSVGDGGGGGDGADGSSGHVAGGNAQSLSTPLGKIHRITTAGAAAPGNPFLGGAPEDDTIWAYGLRNPWRCSFDRLTGQLFAGDVGQTVREEIDIIIPGGNYGWRVLEGNTCFNTSNFSSPLPSCTPPAGYVPPIHDYPRTDGTSVTGGYVYRGSSNPSLFGRYLFGDFGSGRIWMLEETAPGVWSRTELLDTTLAIASLGEDQAGELYVCDLAGGRILRIVETIPVGLAFFGQGSD